MVESEMNMTYGKNGLDLTKGFEKCRLKPYRDGGGVWTNGWGNTHHVDPNITITQEQADRDLLANVQDAVDCVNDNVKVPLTQNQFDALVDFVFNVGGPAFKASTLLRMLNAGDYAGANAQMDRWIMDNGKKVAGLQNRRDAEQALFTQGA
jgi:lysozyme